MTALGNIQSAGIMGQSNAFTNTLGDISSLATGAANAYGQYQAGLPYQNYLNALASTGSSSGLGVAPPPGYAMPRI
jgi:hypothetical protein